MVFGVLVGFTQTNKILYVIIKPTVKEAFTYYVIKFGRFLLTLPSLLLHLHNQKRLKFLYKNI